MLQDSGFLIHGHTKIQCSSFFDGAIYMYIYIFRHVCIYYIYNIDTHTHFTRHLILEVNKLDPFFFTTSDFRCDGRPPVRLVGMIWRQYSEWFGHVHPLGEL